MTSRTAVNAAMRRRGAVASLRRAYDRASDALARHHGSDPYHACPSCPRVQRAWEASLDRVRATRQRPAATASADQEAE